MKLSEIILKIGDDNVTFQNLGNDLDSVSLTRRGVKVSFFTDPENINPNDLLATKKSNKIGLIVWLPRDRVDAILAENSERKPGAAS